jgi:glucose-1-phosphate cytidylyltransferase
MKTFILCGGKGTRLYASNEAIPKALVEIGGRPILWHIMMIYAAQGFDEFVLCLGYKGMDIKEHFVSREGILRGDFLMDTSTSGPERFAPLERKEEKRSLKIVFADTGEDTPTGGRIKIASKYLEGDTFMVTYGDGVADVNLRSLLAFHQKQGTLGTVTVVNPASQFGEVVIGKDNKVQKFREKPKMDRWVNGGFFVFQREFLSYLLEEDVLERGPLERLATEGQLSAFRHEGFWQCMDTFKDATVLNELWSKDGAPWRVWKP